MRVPWGPQTCSWCLKQWGGGGGTIWGDCTLNLWGCGLTQGRWIIEEVNKKKPLSPWALYPPRQRRQTQAHSSNQDFIQGDTPQKLGRLMQGERQVRGRRKECQGRPFSPQSGDSKKKKEKILEDGDLTLPFFDYHQAGQSRKKKKQVKISYWRILLPQRALFKILTVK